MAWYIITINGWVYELKKIKRNFIIYFRENKLILFCSLFLKP